MKKTLLVLVFLILIAGLASAADLSSFHSTPTDRAIGYAGFSAAGQSVTLTYTDATADANIALGESSFSFSSVQVFGDGGEGFLNFYIQETFAYALGGGYSVNGASATVTSAEGYFGSATMGVSTNIPTFVEGLEIMTGIGYHMDCGYAAMYNGTDVVSGLLDLSLAGIGLNIVADWALLGDIGLSLSIDWSIDLWGITFPVAGFSTAVDTLNVNPGVNFGIAVGVSIPAALADELAVATY